MSCNAIEWHRRLSPSLEKIDVLSRLSPCLESDEELALMQSVLLSIISDYIQRKGGVVMSQPSDLDSSLAGVHQQCADLCVILTSIANLQARARKLLPLLLGELKELQLRLQPAIDRLSEDLEEGRP